MDNTFDYGSSIKIICSINDASGNTPDNYKQLRKEYEEKGVWALYGKSKRDDAANWVCLQVAKSIDIGKEILECIRFLFSKNTAVLDVICCEL